MQLIDVALSGTGRRGPGSHRTDVRTGSDHICEKHCRVGRGGLVTDRYGPSSVEGLSPWITVVSPSTSLLHCEHALWTPSRLALARDSGVRAAFAATAMLCVVASPEPARRTGRNHWLRRGARQLR